VEDVKNETITSFNHTSTDAMPGEKGLQGDPGKPEGNGGKPERLMLGVNASLRKHFVLLTKGGKGGKGALSKDKENWSE